MKSFLALCLFLCYIACVTSFHTPLTFKQLPVEKNTTRINVEEQFVTQQLDHFDPENNTTFRQKYFVNDYFFTTKDKNPVIFLLLGGESPIGESWMVGDLTWINLAYEFGALALQLEHRFYGDSSPTQKYTVDSLRYLTIDQILEDIAVFIEYINNKLQLKQPDWIVFGGSYAGSLCVWVKYKFPHLIKGAVCSSSRVVIKLGYPEYYDVKAENIRQVSQECYDVIGEGFRQTETLAQTESGRIILENTFNLCENITSIYQTEKDPNDFLAQLIDMIAFTFPADRGFDIVCSNFITNSSNVNKSSMVRLAEFTNYQYNGSCISYNFTDSVNWYKNIALDAPNTGRPWFWQVCTNVGELLNRGKGSPGNTFGTVPQIDHYVKLCTEVFGEEFNMAKIKALIDRNNMMYGGFSIANYTTNTVSIQGSLDPWQERDQLKFSNDNFKVIYINGTSHCADMFAPSAKDPPALIAARNEIKKLVTLWLNE